MRVNRTILATLALLLLETAVLPWFTPGEWTGRLTPHLAFVMTMFAAFFGGRHHGFLFGLGFGLLSDILFYGHLIGAYGFGMALVGYLAGLAAARMHVRLLSLAWTVLLGGLVLDSIVYCIYMLFRITHESYLFMLTWQIVPTALAQLIFALAIYVPARKLLTKPNAAPADENAD